MADIYKFRVNLCETENILWRDIEITSVSSVAKLGYAILAAIESTASHLFNISYNTERYEVLFDEEDIDDEIARDAIKTNLSSFKLKVGDKLTLEYDYGSSWKFDIILLSVTEMKHGTGTHYPYVTDGRGKGIIEDISPDDFIELIKKTDKDGVLPKIFDAYSGEEKEWDYRNFDLEYCNTFFKDIVSDIQKQIEFKKGQVSGQTRASQATPIQQYLILTEWTLLHSASFCSIFSHIRRNLVPDVE